MPQIHNVPRALLNIYAYLAIGGQKELAPLIGLKPSTLNEYITGKKSGEPGTFPPHILGNLAALIASTSDGRLTKERVLRLLTGPYQDLASALTALSPSLLADALMGLEQTLEVAAAVSDRRSFGLLGGHPRPPEGALFVPKSKVLRFTIKSPGARRLIVICNSVDGWELLCPGDLHDGELSEKANPFPRDRAFSFEHEAVPEGVFKTYRFLFFEAPANTGSDFRSMPGDLSATLSPEEVGRLGVLLGRVKADGELRWRHLYVAIGAMEDTSI